jgi:hypothetical protein
MIKTYCDNCECEITKESPSVVSDRIAFKVKDWKFEVIVSLKGTANAGHLCVDCLRKMIKNANVGSKLK